MSARQIAGACALGAYLLVVGLLGGMIASAIRFDGRRAAVVAKLEDASTRVRAQLMRFAHDATPSAATSGRLTRAIGER